MSGASSVWMLILQVRNVRFSGVAHALDLLPWSDQHLAKRPLRNGEPTEVPDAVIAEYHPPAAIARSDAARRSGEGPDAGKERKSRDQASLRLSSRPAPWRSFVRNCSTREREPGTVRAGLRAKEDKVTSTRLRLFVGSSIRAAVDLVRGG